LFAISSLQSSIFVRDRFVPGQMPRGIANDQPVPATDRFIPCPVHQKTPAAFRSGGK
jgi:hypothetical protein